MEEIWVQLYSGSRESGTPAYTGDVRQNFVSQLLDTNMIKKLNVINLQLSVSCFKR